MIPQRIEPEFTERYESGESVLSAQVNSVKGVYSLAALFFALELYLKARESRCQVVSKYAESH